MSIKEYIEKMKKVQDSLLKFLEERLDVEENYANLKKILSDQKIIEDKHELKSFLRLVSKIGSNHRRIPNFIGKIEQILHEIKDKIKDNFSNSDIFELFKSNKRILLFLIKEDILTIDEDIFSQITAFKYSEIKYPQYFAPEIKPFLTEEFIERSRVINFNPKWIDESIKEIPEDFEKKRLEGENDNYICELIRKQNMQEFIVFMNKEGLSFDSKIKESIFETNPFLIDHKKNINIIEYASFFGCMEIINFLINEKNIDPTRIMWEYGIHGENIELIHYLEDNNVLPTDRIFVATLKESIKCHHINVSRYIIDYLIKEEDAEFNKENDFHDNIYRCSIENYNFCFFPDDIKYKFMFHYLCEFDYYTLVNLYLQNEDIDINLKII